MNNINKIISGLLIIALMFGQVTVAVFAEEAPVVEASAQAPQEPEKPNKPEKPSKPEKGAETENPKTPETPKLPGEEATPTPSQVINTESDKEKIGGVSADGNVGDTTVKTGDASNTGAIYNTANSNMAAGGNGGSGNGINVANTNNGADSNNNASASVLNDNNTNQDNSLVIINNMNQSAITGDNSASKNNGNATIVTGDANVSGTVVTMANTNAAGASISEFNIVNDYFGDYVLDFASNCIAGCTAGGLGATNSNNGANSTNTVGLDSTTNNNINQNNNGDLTNNINLYAETGDNTASKNNLGDTIIETGDANVAANLMTFLSNNIAGGVMFGVVNIFGDLIGDIILPESAFNQFACGDCTGGINAGNMNNGAGSYNESYINDTTNNNYFQSNDANIANNLTLEAETGNNSASKNNQGNTSIETGNTTLQASILNMANMNMVGGNMWLVIVNEAGNWVGKLFGAPEGSNLAGSTGIQFAVDPSGMINVTNEKNGAGSINEAGVNNTTNNDITQTNTANVVNNVNLTANTGGNTADKNNGDVSIKTGDATAIANIVNFVNNNIAGGKLLVTFVNVFGKWNGDFLTPGANKTTSPVVAQGGVENLNNHNNNSSSQNESNNDSNMAVSAKGETVVAAVGFGPGNNQGSISESKAEVKVAGVNNAGLLAGLTKDTSVKNQANINLAWLLLALPIGAGLVLARKRFIKRSA